MVSLTKEVVIVLRKSVGIKSGGLFPSDLHTITVVSV